MRNATETAGKNGLATLSEKIIFVSSISNISEIMNSIGFDMLEGVMEVCLNFVFKKQVELFCESNNELFLLLHTL